MKTSVYRPALTTKFQPRPCLHAFQATIYGGSNQERDSDEIRDGGMRRKDAIPAGMLLVESLRSRGPIFQQDRPYWQPDPWNLEHCRRSICRWIASHAHLGVKKEVLGGRDLCGCDGCFGKLRQVTRSGNQELTLTTQNSGATSMDSAERFTCRSAAYCIRASKK